MSCPICTENFTISMRKETECLYCHAKYCIQCIKKYLLSKNKNPSCMKCLKTWNREFIDLHLSRNFLNNEYKKHRENILFEQELSFIPETLQILELNSEQKMECHQQLRHFVKEKDELLTQLSLLNQKIFNCRHQIYMLDSDPSITLNHLNTIERKKYIKKCVKDDCLGYINQKGHCKLCNTIICMKCFELKMENHECITSNIETIELIKKETKPCPKCNISIYKIEGCNQMWCTNCHSAFHWLSGKLIDYEIHNPHYIDYIQLNQENNIQSNNNISFSSLIHHIKNYDIEPISKNKIINIYRMILHLQNEEIPKYQIENTEIFYKNLNHRISFIHKKMNEQKFKQLLVLKENQEEKKNSLYLLYHMLIHTLILFFQELNQTKDFSLFFEKYNNLIDYINQQLKLLSKRFNFHYFYFDDSLNIIKV